MAHCSLFRCAEFYFLPIIFIFSCSQLSQTENSQLVLTLYKTGESQTEEMLAHLTHKCSTQHASPSPSSHHLMSDSQISFTTSHGAPPSSHSVQMLNMLCCSYSGLGEIVFADTFHASFKPSLVTFRIIQKSILTLVKLNISKYNMLYFYWPSPWSKLFCYSKHNLYVRRKKNWQRSHHLQILFEPVGQIDILIDIDIVFKIRPKWLLKRCFIAPWKLD